MSFHPGILVGAGFLLGSLGIKAATSKPAKRAYVKGMVCTMKAKESVNTMIDEAKAEFDDLMAEAGYERSAEGGQFVAIEAADAAGTDVEAEAGPDEAPAKKKAQGASKK